MSETQWRLCYLNVIEDERDTTARIKNLVEIAVRLFTGSDGNPEDKEKLVQAIDPVTGSEPTKDNPDIRYAVPGANVEIHKILSTEYDKVLEEEATKGSTMVKNNAGI